MELKLITKSRDIKDYKEKFEEDLIKILSKQKPKINLYKKEIKEIKKDFSELRHRFSKSKINEFRRSFYNIKNPRNLSTSEIKETRKKLLELEKSLYNLKKYYDYDDNKYQGIKDIGNLFIEVDKDYYKPILLQSNMKAKETEIKNYCLKNILILSGYI